MSAIQILMVIAGYFLLLLFVAYITSRKSSNKDFFIGGKQSPWFLVAFGMIGASLSGVTFISVPGWAGTNQFAYMQIVLGYMVGYFIIAFVLMPIYYRLNVTSIYKYLEERFGFWSYKTGAAYFLLSRVIGASFRLFLVAGVLQLFVFQQWGVPFEVTVAITIFLIWIYTFKGGIKTIVWTDALQTFFMLSAMLLSFYFIARELNFSFFEMTTVIIESPYSKIFFWDWESPQFFVKEFVSGALIATVMTGLDQDMMQKNLSIRRLKDAQKNIFSQMPMFIVFNVLFLCLGALLYIFAMAKYSEMTGLQPDPDGLFPATSIQYLGEEAGLTKPGGWGGDDLFPLIAIKYMGFVGVIFIIGLIAAAYSSADSALTALTTSFCVDFLGMDKGEEKHKTRYAVHIGFSILLLITIVIFKKIGDESVIKRVFEAAGYTYGPLLGLFSFGIFMNRRVFDKAVPFICIASPLLIFFIKSYEGVLLGGYQIGFELLLYNGLLTFLGLLLFSSAKSGINERHGLQT